MCVCVCVCVCVYTCRHTTILSYIQEGRKDMFYLTTHSTHFIYGYMASDISTQIAREETRCRHSYSFRLTARVLLYAPSHRQDSTYHGFCYTSREYWLEREIDQWRIDPTNHRTMSERSYHGTTTYTLMRI